MTGLCYETNLQINHKYEERRLLVAQSCGELAEFVRPEIRDSLILSIIQQLIEDSATIVREAAAHNLALLLPLFPNLDKYFKVSLTNAQRPSWSRNMSSQNCLTCKLYNRLEQMAPGMVEDLMFQLVCDPSGAVVDTTIKELVPAVVNWGAKLDHVLRVILSHILGSAQVPYIDVKAASTHVLPALVTLGSDPDLNVKYASIEAFGAVAQHFKNDMVLRNCHYSIPLFLKQISKSRLIKQLSFRLLTRYAYKWMLFLKMDLMKLLLLLFVHYLWLYHIQQTGYVNISFMFWVV
ncbi:hypothetical protein BHE74_00032148 [Ensete ventricosum]|nr:hypothetical protein GW17_00004607 [Ensete ventricosum]RWW60823.1 hypothetical protein BHE74_00032148 [Ensete ventricosum]